MPDDMTLLVSLVDGWADTTEKFRFQISSGFVPNSVALREFEANMHQATKSMMALFERYNRADSSWFEGMMELCGQARAQAVNDNS